MDTGPQSRKAQGETQADRHLVEALFGHGHITRAARDRALQFLYPHENWGLWVSRSLLGVGTSLVLAGIIFFFAFNWAKMGPAIKLGGIEVALLGCLVAAYFAGLRKAGGKFLLLSASVLVGVFLAVFGQIYQTGADAYTLFMVWGILIAGWVVLAEFAPLWVVWLVVCNLFLGLFWDQAVGLDGGHPLQALIFTILAMFNLGFLGAREFAVAQGTAWLSGRWTRVILVVPVLTFLMVPTLALIFEPSSAVLGIQIGAAASVVVHAGLFLAYVELRDMWPIIAVFLSACVAAEVAVVKILTDTFEKGAAPYLLGGIVTIGLFSLAAAGLREVAKHMEMSHGR